MTDSEPAAAAEKPHDLATQAPPVAPFADEKVKTLMVKRMEDQFREYAGANLKIDEANFLVLDERGGIEYRCFTAEDAEDLASVRVQNVGGIHVIFQRVAVVRAPRAEVVIEK